MRPNLNDTRRRQKREILRDLDAIQKLRVATDEQALRLLHRWRSGGGREEMLGTIPLAERRQVEEKARQQRGQP